MTERLIVLMNATVAATVTKTDRGIVLEYDREYRRERASTPLSLSLPLQAGTHDPKSVEPWMAGLLPDNDNVLRRWAREFETTTAPFDLLGSPVGEDCAGAVQFVTEERVERVQKRPGEITWITEEDIAQLLVALREDQTAWLLDGFAGRFSLAGAQAKTALYYDGSRWGVPSGAAATTHILKPAIAGLDHHDLNEHLCLSAARSAGLLAARTAISNFAGTSALVVERYDREVVDGDVQRIHQEDTCQALSVPPTSKYQADGGPSVSSIRGLLRDNVRPAAAASADIAAFLDALIWNWVIGGTDAHAKNYSLLLVADRVRLAPLYDVASILAYPNVDQMKLKSAMKLGGDYRFKAHRRSTWAKVARELGLETERSIARVSELVGLAPQALADAAGQPSVETIGSPLPPRLVDAVVERAEFCARQLDERE
jgi:serine/threonine-protein kinase HipA